MIMMNDGVIDDVHGGSNAKQQKGKDTVNLGIN